MCVCSQAVACAYRVPRLGLLLDEVVDRVTELGVLADVSVCGWANSREGE